MKHNKISDITSRPFCLRALHHRWRSLPHFYQIIFTEIYLKWSTAQHHIIEMTCIWRSLPVGSKDGFLQRLDRRSLHRCYTFFSAAKAIMTCDWPQPLLIVWYHFKGEAADLALQVRASDRHGASYDVSPPPLRQWIRTSCFNLLLFIWLCTTYIQSHCEFVCTYFNT